MGQRSATRSRRVARDWRRDSRRASGSWRARSYTIRMMSSHSNATDRPFERLAVVGAGNMGSGIAQKMATEGFAVTLVDLDDEKVGRGMSIIEKTLTDGVQRGIFAAPDVAAILGRISGTSRFEDLAAVDLVVEAVFEDLEIKKTRLCPPRRGLPARHDSCDEYVFVRRHRSCGRNDAAGAGHWGFTISFIRRRTGWSRSLPDGPPIRSPIGGPGAFRKRWGRRRSPRATRTASSSTASSCPG